MTPFPPAGAAAKYLMMIFIIDISLACLLLAVTSDSHAAQCSTPLYRRYVDLFGGSDNSTCGVNQSTACRTVQHALNISDAGLPVCLRLVSSNWNSTASRLLRPTVITNRDDITIDGSELGPVTLNLNVSGEVSDIPQVPGSAEHIILGRQWLAFLNCSNIILENLQLILSNFSGQHVFLFVDSHSVDIENSSMSFASVNSSTLFFLDSWPVSIKSVVFEGDTFSKMLPPTQENDYSTSAVVFEALCDSEWCSKEKQNLTNPCCHGRAVQSDTNTTLLITHSTFKHLGLLPVNDLYFQAASTPKGGMAVRFVAANNSGASMDVTDCHFFNNSSPYDATVKILFKNGTANGTSRFSGCHFQENRAYLGGAITYEVLDTSVGKQQKLVLLNSTFTNNTAVLEGGAIQASLATTESAVEVMLIDECSFVGNVGGNFLTSNLVGGALSISYYDSLPKDAARSAHVPTVAIKNTQFVRNTAVYGSAVFLKSILAVFTNM